MDKQDVIERLCALATEVMKREFECRLAADCFCGKNKFNVGNYSLDREVLEFIERAVRKELDARVSAR